MDIRKPQQRIPTTQTLSDVEKKKPASTEAAQTTQTTATTQAAQTVSSQAHAGLDNALRGPVFQSLDSLWQAKSYSKIVDVIAAEIAPLQGVDFKGLDSTALIGAMSKVYLLEERLKSTLNQLSMTDSSPAKLKGLKVGSDLADISTKIFRQAVSLQDAADPQPVSAWLVAKDTHKNAHKWTPTEHLSYVAQKTVEFYLKGGDNAQIRDVDAKFLSSLKSGQLCEYVVDAYDSARASVVEPGRPSPGHTVLAKGNDALTAGTFEVQKNAQGEITSVVIGTFSGHYRTGLDAQEHLARHIIAALSQMYPNETPERLTKMVLRREGQATNPRTFEVIGRGIGLDGADAQNLEARLRSEALRWNPLGVIDKRDTFATSLQKELVGIKEWVVGSIKSELFLDASQRKKQPKAGEATSVHELLTRLDAFMEKAVAQSDMAAGAQLINTLQALMTYAHQLPAGAVDAGARVELDQLTARWNNGVAGTTGTDIGAMFSAPPVGRATRLVATINPKATDEHLKDMLRAGMDVARFNTAHGSLDEKIGVMKKLRRFAAEMGKPITIQVDLEGPKLRLRTFDNPKKLEHNDVWLKVGDTATLTTKDILGSQDKMLFPVDYPTMIDDVKVGDPVSMNDGIVKLTVKSVDKAAQTLTCEVTQGGKVWDNKGVAFPKSHLSGQTVTDEDLQNLTALIDHVDVFAQSFVQSADDVLFLRQRMADLGQVKPIIAKIERGNIALDAKELTEIALASDGLMVARGDLGVELGEAQLPRAERLIRDIGERTGKPVMLATEVMMSVLSESRGSRGDVDALYGAVVDRKFHAIMLGKETSSHKSPGDVIREVSSYIAFNEGERDKPQPKLKDQLGTTTAAALFLSRGGLKPINVDSAANDAPETA